MNGVFWISIVLLSLGAGMIAYGFILGAKARACIDWPSTRGEITHSEYIDSSDTSSFEIKYGYEIRGRRYTCNRVFVDILGLQLHSNADSWNKEVVERYPEGTPVTVYYNPENHEDACLRRESRSSFFYVFGVIILIMGIMAY